MGPLTEHFLPHLAGPAPAADLEPLLIELAYEAHKATPESLNRMQKEVRDTLLFRVRVMNQQLKQPNIST